MKLGFDVSRTIKSALCSKSLEFAQADQNQSQDDKQGIHHTQEHKWRIPVDPVKHLTTDQDKHESAHLAKESKHSHHGATNLTRHSTHQKHFDWNSLDHSENYERTAQEERGWWLRISSPHEQVAASTTQGESNGHNDLRWHFVADDTQDWG